MTGSSPSPQAAEAWAAVLGAALLGTERRPWPGAPATDGLPPLPGGADGLLTSAALLSVWREAGRTAAPPAVDGSGPPPPPADTRALLPPAARQLLTTLLQGRRQPALLDEWLDRAAASGRRLPGALYVDLLVATVGEAGRRHRLTVLGGPLADWLARANPDWSELARSPQPELDLRADDGPARWAEASDETRLAAFARLRASDPAAAAVMLAQVVPHESSAVAVALLERMAVGLTTADADVLERALDDRRKRVRTVAAGLLDRLPTSARAARLAAFATRTVTVTGRFRRSLVVTEPPPPDDAAGQEAQERDGIAGTPSERLRQLVAGAALSAWETELGRPPGELVRLAAAAPEPLARVLVEGWILAAEQQRDAGWVRALLDADVPPTRGLLDVLDPDEADSRLAGAVAGAGLTGLPGLVAACTGAWGGRASEAAISAVARIVGRTDLSQRPDPALTRAALALQSALGPLALRLHPQTDPRPLIDAVSRAPTPSFWLQAVAGSGATTGLAGILAFRAALATAFPDPTPAPGSSP